MVTGHTWTFKFLGCYGGAKRVSRINGYVDSMIYVKVVSLESGCPNNHNLVQILASKINFVTIH